MDLKEMMSELERSRHDGLVRRAFGIQIKADSVDEKARSVRVIASTEAIDSFDEVVEQTWDLTRYNLNPVVLWAHNRSGIFGMGGAPSDSLPIGFATDVGVISGRLEATLNFVDQTANDMAEKVWQGFRQGSIRAVSVGFDPHKITFDEDNDIVILSENELFEISAVPLPANHEAVALSSGERQRERARLKALATKTAPSGQQQESDMTKEQQEKLEAELAAAKKAADEAKASLKSAEESHAAFKAGVSANIVWRSDAAKDAGDAATAIKHMGEDLAAAREQVSKAAADAIEKEVKGLVGKKIKTGDIERFVKLRTSDPELFKSVVDGLPDMKLTDEVTGGDKPEDRRNKATGSGTRGAPTLIAEAQKRADEAAARSN